MGLDTSHNCWHGSYSGFSTFRDVLGEAAARVKGYSPDYSAHPRRAFYGWWDADHNYSDILDVLFVHSDCEGYIFPEHATALADALEELAPHVKGNDYVSGHLTEFIAGLRLAGDEWEIVEFH